MSTETENIEKCPYHQGLKNETKMEDLPLPKGKSGLPFLGETLDFIKSPEKFVKSRTDQYGSVFLTNILGSKTVFVTGAKGNQWAFGGENKFLRSVWPDTVFSLLGEDCLITITGKRHRNRRKMLAPFFDRKKVIQSLDSIKTIVDKHLAEWEKKDKVSVIPAIRRMAFEIALELLFEKNSLDQEALSKEFEKFTAGLFVPVNWNIPFTPFNRALKAKSRIRKVIQKLVEDRLNQEDRGNDILGSLLKASDENGEQLSKESIINELILFVFAGHDTTVTTTSNLIMLMTHFEDVQEKCYQEVSAVKDITEENVERFTYLEQTINESMRYIPPIGNAFRQTTEDVVYEGYRIPKGWTIGLSMWNSHHHEQHFAEVDQFNPDRFSPEIAEDKKQACAFIPFGGGARTCIGMHFAMQEMIVMMAKILQKFKLEEIKGQDMTYSYIPFPLPKKGFKVSLVKR